MCNEHIPLTRTTEVRTVRGAQARREQFLALLRLSGIQGFGPHRISQCVAHFGSAHAVVHADRNALVASGLVNAAGANAVIDCRKARIPAGVLNRFDQPRASERIVLIGEPEYPALLRQISQPPLWLWIRGPGSFQRGPCLAMVGSRNATQWGIDKTREWCYRLAGAGVTIVSGLADGIDTAAHEGALDAGGQTLAVMGTGLDNVYPKRNRKLASEISQKGLLVTEFHPDEGARPHHFPRRNRIIAGLCQATIVIEAGKGSGSLITAKMAQDEGREVGLVSGRPGDRNAAGTNLGIRENIGELISSIDDVLAMLKRQPAQTGVHPSGTSPNRQKKSESQSTVAVQRRPAVYPDSLPGKIRVALKNGPIALEDLQGATGLSRSSLEEALLDLLLDGWVVLEYDQRYRWRR